MATSYDEKGKFFTNVISKIPVDVIIQTHKYRISGKAHIRLENRLKDEVTGSESFLAITEATIEDEQNELLYRTKFMLVNREQIIWILPINELEQQMGKS